MGADLYILRLPNRKRSRGFNSSLKAGYFRDAYNYSNLLWQFDLSYWNVVLEKYVNQNNEMGIRNAKKLLAELRDRETIFKQNLQDLLDKKNIHWDYKQKDGERVHIPESSLNDKQRLGWVKRYKAKYLLLRQFLKKAIELKSPILCSF